MICPPELPVRELAQAFLIASARRPQRDRWRRARRLCVTLLVAIDSPAYAGTPDAAWDREWIVDLWLDFLAREALSSNRDWARPAA